MRSTDAQLSTPAPSTICANGGSQATVTVVRGNTGAVTQTDVVYRTTRLSGTVWVGYVNNTSVPLFVNRQSAHHVIVVQHSTPLLQIRPARQHAGGPVVGLANAQRNGLRHVQGTVGRSAGKDMYLSLYGGFSQLNCPLVLAASLEAVGGRDGKTRECSTFWWPQWLFTLSLRYLSRTANATEEYSRVLRSYLLAVVERGEIVHRVARVQRDERGPFANTLYSYHHSSKSAYTRGTRAHRVLIYRGTSRLQGDRAKVLTTILGR